MMRRLLIAALGVGLFGAGMVAGQARYSPAEHSPFYYTESLTTKEGLRLQLAHWRADYADSAVRGQCVMVLYRGGTLGDTVTQIVDVRFCQWLQQP